MVGDRPGQWRRAGGVGWVTIVVLLAVLAGAGAGVWAYLQRRGHVQMVTVRRGTVVRAFYATGVVRPDREYVLKSRAQGILIGLDKREQATVYKDERLARVDDKQLRFEVERATAELNEAVRQAADDAPQRLEIVARLTEARQQTDLARQGVERTQASFDRQAATVNDLDVARRSHVQWVNTVAALEGQLGTWKIASRRAVEVAEANLRKAQANLADADVVSPVDGIILERYVENREVVGINQRLLLVAAADDMLMKAAVDEEDVTRTHVGQKVEMQLYAFRERDGDNSEAGRSMARILEGKVVEILPSANAANKTYEVKVAFVARPEGLRVGMTGELNFIEEESARDGALVIPSSAVLDKKVYRRKGTGYEAVAVTLGIRTLDRVEVREGLREGEEIVADVKQVAPVKLPPQKQPVVPVRTGDQDAP